MPIVINASYRGCRVREGEGLNPPTHCSSMKLLEREREKKREGWRKRKTDEPHPLIEIHFYN
jgi:hypothetical protein